MLASRRDRLLWPGSVCRATPAYDARGTFENVCCSCTPSGNNHQLAGASRHLHEKCPKGEALGAVCCWSQDRPTPETGGRPPSVCLEHRTVLDHWWAPPRRFHPSALPRRSRATRSAVTCATPHWPMLGGSSVRNMRVQGPVPGWDARIDGCGNVVSSVHPLRARDEGLEGLSQASVCCVSSHSDGTVRGTTSHMSLDASSVFLDGVTHGIQMRKSVMDGGWRADGGHGKSRFCRSFFSIVAGGECSVRGSSSQRERAGHPNKDVSWMGRCGDAPRWAHHRARCRHWLLFLN